jgi:hypothetical protein
VDGASLHVESPGRIIHFVESNIVPAYVIFAQTCQGRTSWLLAHEEKQSAIPAASNIYNRGGSLWGRSLSALFLAIS